MQSVKMSMLIVWAYSNVVMVKESGPGLGYTNL